MKQTRSFAAKKYRQENPEKCRAHFKVWDALRKGVIRKGPCESCGSLVVQGDHEDGYDKGQWVVECANCHKRKTSAERCDWKWRLSKPDLV